VVWEGVKSLFSKPVTRRYPFEGSPAPEGYKGRHFWDPKKCTYCGVCAINCPARVITVDKANREYHLDLRGCIFCGRCEDTCPFDAIHLTKDYSMSSAKKEEMEID
jgi:formate hydrogenlyase subunit 6/NADH:ubiquinone oxidoreductase subunit I